MGGAENQGEGSYLLLSIYIYVMSEESSDGSITLVGTTHVSPSSIQHMRNIIEEENPEIVAVELCGRRYDGPTNGNELVETDPHMHMRTALLLPLMQHLQTRSARRHNLDPEVTDMNVAIKKAKEVSAEVTLLDRDILRTFERFWDIISFRESIRVIASIGLGLVRGESALLDVEPDEGIDVDCDVSEYLNTTSERYPTFRRVFIDERDQLMAQRLAYLRDKGYDVVAVIGAAHRPGIEDMLDSIEPAGRDVTIINPRPDIDEL